MRIHFRRHGALVRNDSLTQSRQNDPSRSLDVFEFDSDDIRLSLPKGVPLCGDFFRQGAYHTIKPIVEACNPLKRLV